jgi:flavin-dependent dehydrogenase
MYDAIIVGARCAGAPLAMLLARKGHRVLLLDKASFPSDRISTHFVMQAGLARVKRWGLLEKVCALGAPPMRRGRMDAGDCEFSGYPPPIDDIDYALAPRRTFLDKLLIDEALSSGAELREGFHVDGVLTDAKRVTGVSGRSRGESRIAENARIVVGADGPASVIARAVCACKYNEQLSAGGAYYSYWHGAPAINDFEMYMRPGYGGMMFPTNDGLTCIVGGWSDEAFGAKRSPAQAYRAYMQAIPRLSQVLSMARQIEPLKGMQVLHGYFRQSWGPGWALAGDAGYHKHPISAQGIADAFRDADSLADAIDAGLAGPAEMDQALSRYQQDRDATVMPMYQSTCQRARLQPLPLEVQAMFRALQENQDAANAFFGLDAGTVSIPKFFSPDNLKRIMNSKP